jgi:hypothetical protein
MRRVGFLYGWLVLLLAAFGGFAWLTRHPATPWLERAARWPVVGPVAARFRAAYLPPAPAAETDEQQESGGERVTLVRRRPDGVWEILRDVDRETAARALREGFVVDAGPLPDPSAIPAPLRERRRGEGASPETAESGPPAAPPPMSPSPSTLAKPPAAVFTDYIQPLPLDRIWLLPGAALRDGPDAQAAAVASLPTLAYLPVYRRRGDWVEVAYRSRRSWVASAAGDLAESFPRHAKPARILRPEPADLLRLRRARGILELEEPSGTLGPYRLFTDVEDPALLPLLDGAAQRIEHAYFARYGRAAGGLPHQAVVMFGREEDYRLYAAGDRIPGSGQQWGHAGSGVVAFFVAGQSRQEAVRTLVHELTHLLNKRALAPLLPPWLEEGMAADLGIFWMEDTERPRAQRRFGLDGLEIQSIDFHGHLVVQALDEGSLPPLADLLFLDRDAFYAEPVRARNYAHSLLFVRYLLDGSPELAAGFRSFLAEAATGRLITGGVFLDLLGVSQPELEDGFRDWVRTAVPRVPGANRASGQPPAAAG